MHIPILGTLPEQIDAAEDREKFDEILESLDIRRPKGKGVWTLEEGIAVANELTFPVLVRPSYVLGGQGMEITHNEAQLTKYLVEASEKDWKDPVFTLVIVFLFTHLSILAKKFRLRFLTKLREFLMPLKLLV